MSVAPLQFLLLVFAGSPRRHGAARCGNHAPCSCGSRPSQTRAAVLLPRTAQIAPVPRILAEPAVISAGSPTTVVVRASVASERYQLAQDAQPLGAARDGDGSDLVFTTAPVFENTRFQVLVTRPGGPGIPVRRIVEILVTVAPPDP